MKLFVINEEWPNEGDHFTYLASNQEAAERLIEQLAIEYEIKLTKQESYYWESECGSVSWFVEEQKVHE